MNIYPYHFGMPWTSGNGFVVFINEKGEYEFTETTQEDIRELGKGTVIFQSDDGALAYIKVMNNQDAYAPALAEERGRSFQVDARTQIATALFAGMLPKGIEGVGPGKFDIMRAAAIRQADLLLMDLLTTDPCDAKDQ